MEQLSAGPHEAQENQSEAQMKTTGVAMGTEVTKQSGLEIE